MTNTKKTKKKQYPVRTLVRKFMKMGFYPKYSCELDDDNDGLIEYSGWHLHVTHDHVTPIVLRSNGEQYEGEDIYINRFSSICEFLNENGILV